MEKYIDRSSIVSLETHEKELIVEYFRVYVKPFKLFGIFKMSEGKWVYQTSEEYRPGYKTFESIEQAFNFDFNNNRKRYLVEDGRIYRKPYIVMIDKNKNIYNKYFNDEKELDEYIESLDLDIVKKYVKLKLD